MSRPIRTSFTIPWGAQFGAARAGGKRRHNGTDYHCPVGTPIYGTGQGGRVLHIGYNGDPWLGLGHNITIIYPDGKTLDAHMQHRSPLWVGAPVGPNTLVGYVGLTGNAVNASPPGSHLHHERRKNNGLLINPEVHYGGSPAGGQIVPIAIEEEDEDMPTYELWKTATTGDTVWFVVDRLWRYGIPNAQAIGDYQSFIKSKGQDSTIRQAALGAIGAPVYNDGVTTSQQFPGRMPTVPTAAQIAAAVKELIPGGGGITDKQLEQLAADISERVKVPTQGTITLS